MSTNSAAVRVLGLPELLAMVLRELPTVNLFALRRVDQTFLGTINDFKDIRVRMHRDTSGRFLDLRETLLDSRLLDAIYPFHIGSFRRVKCRRDCKECAAAPIYDLLITLSYPWIIANRNAKVADLFAEFPRRTSQASWGLIGVNKRNRRFRVTLAVYGRQWGVFRWHAQENDTLRLYQVINKCKHMVCRGWKKKWHRQVALDEAGAKTITTRLA